MIRVFVKKNDKDSERLLDQLRELVVSHRIIYVKNQLIINDKETPLPVIMDDDRVIQGKEEISEYIDELKKYLSEWQKFQSDACYCDDEGNIE